MKPGIKNPFRLLVLKAILGLGLAGEATGQTFTTLHDFTAPDVTAPYTNGDGAYRVAGLVLSGNGSKAPILKRLKTAIS